MIPADPGNPAEAAGAERLDQRVMRRALAADGACAGERGAGRHKVPPPAGEFGGPAVELVRRLEAARDPLNILNPGKVAPAP